MRISHVIEQEQMDEGLLDFVKKVGSVLDPVARARHHGAAELNKLHNQSLTRFSQFMGRQKKTFADATWNMLYSYITNRNQLGISAEDAKRLIVAKDTINKVRGLLTSSKLPLPPAASWGNKNSPISGDAENPNSEKVGQLIATYILELAAIKYLETTDKGADLEEPRAQQPKAAQQQQAAQPAATQTAQPAAAPAYNPVNAPVAPAQPNPQAQMLYQLQLAMHHIQGANP